MNPQHAYVSGPSGEQMHGLMLSEPSVGDPLQLFLDNGKVMRTSAVRKISRTESELVVDTLNSRYRIKLES